MTILVRHTPQNLTREQYDKVNEVMREHGAAEPPPALKIHVLFGDDGNLQVSEIWESEAAFDEAYPDLKQALDAGGVQYGEPMKLPISELWGSGLAPQ
jgi:hypothetical protein